MRRVLLSVSIITLLGAAAGCTPQDEPTPTPIPPPSIPALATTAPAPSPTPEPSPTPSPTPTPSASPSPSPTAVESFPVAPATETDEQAAIRAAVMEYWRIYEKFTADPSLADLSETQLITAGDHQNRIIEIVADFREAGLKTSGNLAFRDMTVGAPVADDPDGVRRSRVTYCLDDSNFHLIFISSGETRPNQRTSQLWETMTLAEGLDGLWRVEDTSNEPREC